MTILYSGVPPIPSPPGVSHAVGLWIRKGNRKAPKLLKSELRGIQPIRTPEGPAMNYTIIYEFNGKVRIGTVHDYMHTRYGISCHGATTSTDIMDLWQAGPGCVSAGAWEAMCEYLNGESTLPDFDFGSLKGLQS